jgi:hypothetical protein
VTLACGKKGPPLAPYVRIPTAPEIAGARRVGNEIHVSVKVPATNIDASKPASLDHIDLYAVTALTPPPRAQFLAMAGRPIATVPVAREADPSDRSGTVVADPTAGVLQGTTVTIRDPLSADALVPKEPPATETRRQTGQGTPADDEPPRVLRRFYMTVAFSDRKRSSPPSAVAELPLTTLPEKVRTLRVLIMASNLVLDWEPSGGLVGWLLERALPREISPVPEPPAAAAASTSTPSTELPAGPTAYNVYREIAPNPLALPDQSAASPWAAPAADPVNMAPLNMLTFAEEVPFDGRQRCYQVRAVRGTGAQRVESDASDRVCIVPVDVEPPTAVTGLSARISEGEIRLSWEPNGEEDLRGYLVLRREAADDTLQKLTPTPISDTRFTDSGVMAGRMYTYVVHAVDNRIPLPNLSDPTETTAMAR